MDYKLRKSHMNYLTERGVPSKKANEILGKAIFSRKIVNQQFLENEISKVLETK